MKRIEKNYICIKIGNWQFCKFLKFEGVFIKKDYKLSKLRYYCLCGKVNFSVIHPTHITIYSFWRTIFSSKVLWIIGKCYILTVTSIDNWTFFIFFVFNIVFPLELEARLYCFSITIWKGTSPAQMGCSKTWKWIL